MTTLNNKKVAWVVGVNQGIGAEIVQQLLARDMTVVGFDVAIHTIAPHPNLELYQCDVRDAEQIKQHCETLLKRLAPDYFVYAAGVLHLAQHDQTSVEQWQHTFAVNTFAPFYFLQHLSPYFRAKGCGSLVMISSNSAHAPRINMAAYGASKAALTSFTQTVGLELAEYGVRVNIVSPGSTATPMLRQLWKDDTGEQTTIQGNLAQYKVGIPLQKIAQTADIANAVIFLLSDQAKHITMHDLVVDGGATLGQ